MGLHSQIRNKLIWLSECIKKFKRHFLELGEIKFWHEFCQNMAKLHSQIRLINIFYIHAFPNAQGDISFEEIIKMQDIHIFGISYQTFSQKEAKMIFP